jgi:hypothetical protein
MRLLLLSKVGAQAVPGAALLVPGLMKARDLSRLVRKEITDKNGHRTTVYVKPEAAQEGGQGAPAPTANTAPPIAGVAPITVTSQNYGEIAKREFEKLRKKIISGLYCPALENRQVVGTKAKHLKETKGKRRTESEILQRVSLMPYIIPIIEHGTHTESRNSPKGPSYKITGRVQEKDGYKNISVILIEDPKSRLLYFSVFQDTSDVSKSLTQMGGSFPSGCSIGFPSHLGREQGLNSPNRNFIIPDISVLSTDNFSESCEWGGVEGWERDCC